MRRVAKAVLLATLALALITPAEAFHSKFKFPKQITPPKKQQMYVCGGKFKTALEAAKLPDARRANCKPTN